VPVKAAVCREEIAPPRGGTSAERPITCRAAQIFPEKAGLEYVAIDGFDVRHSAPR
jgi:hypothetical protein